MITTKDIEYAVSCFYDYRLCNIIPNISWGVGLHECDLLIVKRNMWAIEVEIKVSKSDLKADLKKEHQHRHEMISELHYALPKSLYEECKEIIPAHAGIITVTDNLCCDRVRDAKKNKDARKITEEELTKILRLGNMRTWSLRKRALQEQGKVRIPKRETARERYDKELLLAVKNACYFLSRKRFTNEIMLEEEIAYLSRIMEKY